MEQKLEEISKEFYDKKVDEYTEIFNKEWEKEQKNKNNKIQLEGPQFPTQVPFKLLKKLSKSNCKKCRGNGFLTMVVSPNNKEPITKENRKSILATCFCVIKNYYKQNNDEKIEYNLEVKSLLFKNYIENKMSMFKKINDKQEIKIMRN